MLNKFWRNHISVKKASVETRYHMCGSLRGSAECDLLLCDGRNGQSRSMKRRKMGGIVPRRVHVNIYT